MKYSFIVPTYNSMKWIDSCVSSILNQQLNDFNLIILDSGSTDRTVSYLEELKDERILIYKTQNRLGILENWNRILSIEKNEFMTIVGHDDVIDSNYLSTIDNLVTKYPDASLYQTHFRFIDGAGEKIRDCIAMDLEIDAKLFLEKVLQNKLEITATGFMVRSRDYERVGGIPLYPNLLYADIELWLNLILNSSLIVSPKNCFSFRFHIENTSKSPGRVRLIAFERMIDFFVSLQKSNTEYKLIFDKYSTSFLENYVVGACHKLLYVPHNERNGVQMQNIIASAKECAKKLTPNLQFSPENYSSIRLAILIDKYQFLSRVFLFYKSFKKRTF